MMKILPLQFIFRFIILSIIFLLFTSVTYAQENPEEVAKKHGVSFPVVELGNCGSFSACKSFCDNESNREICINFAKKKGFYREEDNSKKTKILESAKADLGCNSEASCRAICEQEANREKCMSFSQKHGYGKPKGNPGDKRVLEKAKEILGCDSPDSCKSVCEKEENQQKCVEFAQQSGLGGGVRRTGPGGCNSEESCRAFCKNNPDECQKFGGAPAGQDSGRRGPGGCDSEESCKKYCESNPDLCKSFGGGRGPEDMERYCKENPDKCSGEKFSGSGDSISPYDYCKKNPDKCHPPEESFKRPGGGQREEYKYQPQMQRQENFRPQEQAPNVYQGEQYQQPQEFRQSDGNFSTQQTIQQQAPQEIRGASTSKNIIQRIWQWFNNPQGFHLEI